MQSPGAQGTCMSLLETFSLSIDWLDVSIVITGYAGSTGLDNCYVLEYLNHVQS